MSIKLNTVNVAIESFGLSLNEKKEVVVTFVGAFHSDVGEGLAENIVNDPEMRNAMMGTLAFAAQHKSPVGKALRKMRKDGTINLILKFESNLDVKAKVAA